MALDKIVIKGARTHNLKNIDLEIPKDKLVVFTGVSGSGKSSLAFDTIYAEGQRRYVESLSSYARQFLGVMDKPDVDYIEGLSPAISIDQKSSGHNPRSTVGTVTEIYDYLRLLFARVGHPHSPTTGKRLKSQSVQEIVDALFQLSSKEDVKLVILAPVVKNRKGTYEELFTRFLAQGYVRARVDGEIYSLEEKITLEKQKKHSIEIVVDRLSLKNDSKKDESFTKRLTDSVEAALNLGEGELLINVDSEEKDRFFSENLVDPETGESFPKVEPHSFSFNSPFGACEDCNGLGVIKNISEELLLNPNLSITEGGIFPWQNITESPDSWSMRLLTAMSLEEGFDLRKAIKNMSRDHLDLVLYGSKKKYKFNYVRQMDGVESSYTRAFEGVIQQLLRRYKETESDYIRSDIEQYMIDKPCPTCEGKRLKKTSLSVTLSRKNIYEVCNLPINKFVAWVEEQFIGQTDGQVEVQNLSKEDALTKQEFAIAERVLKEIKLRSSFLTSVGLGYLTLNRTARTLSGGESQRIRLASQIGTGLTGVLYVLDEPSIGLHQDDNEKLLKSLTRLRDLGNSVIIVEHDEDTIRSADYIVDIGPRAGEHGGEVVFSGTLDEFRSATNSITADYINLKKQISSKSIMAESIKLVPKHEFIEKKNSRDSKFLKLTGASHNNLKSVDIEIPLQKFVAVTGVSGSGKSSLINDTLYEALNKSKKEAGSYTSLTGHENLDKVVDIDQAPIGRTPRSNPATYTGLFTVIRTIFASTREAKSRGYGPGRFSFNTKGGRCEHCKGDGVLKIEMQFLPDVYVQCEVCQGNRYNRETLQIDFKGKNIADVLKMTVEEGMEFFKNVPSINAKLNTLNEVGLGYIRLGQSATTLSGGEAQRVKLATELSKRSTGKTIYILDEPTTGLHFEDVRRLLIVLRSLVLKGNTVVVIEHNLDLIKTADWIIDLGPAGGEAGGEIVATGSPEEIAENKNSLTGKWLKKYMH